MKLAPIVLFAYNRASHVRLTLESLSANELAADSDLFIYADGPKPSATAEQIQKINEVRKVIREKKWCKTVTINESAVNKGLANSIIEGVTNIVNKFDKIIVIEDDVIFSPYFLKFMNDAIELYKDQAQVLSIGSWSYFCPPEKFSGDTYFFRFPDCKGWATFKRAWNLFEPDAAVAYKKLKQQKKLALFNAGLPYPYFTNMLKDQINGKINSWAIRWTATAILNDKLSLFPKQTLSKDIGFGDEATHESTTIDYNKDLIINPYPVILKTITIEENSVSVDEWKSFYLKYFIPPLTLERTVREGIKKIVPEKFIKLYRDLKYRSR